MKYFPPDLTFASRPELYDETLNVIQDAVMCDGISIFEPDGDALEFKATRTFARDLLRGLKLKVGTGIVGLAAQKAEGVISNRPVSHPDFYALLDHALRFKTRSVMCCPMRHAGRVVGVLEMVNKVDQEDFDAAELASSQSLADGAAAYWRDASNTERRETFYELTRMLRKIVGVEGISLFILEDDDELYLRFSDTTRKTGLEGATIPADQGVAGTVASGRKSCLVPNVLEEPRFFEGVDAKSMFSTHSIVAVPVLDGEKIFAVLELVNARGSESFTAEDLEVLERIAAELAVRIRRL